MANVMIVNLITAETSSSRQKASNWIIRRDGYSSLFLDFPTGCEKAFNEISYGTSVPSIMEKLRTEGVYRDPEDAQHYRSSESLLRMLPSLRVVGVDVRCYLSPLRHSASADLAGEVFILTYRAKMGRINAREWKRLIAEYVQDAMKSYREEARTILRYARDRNICLNLAKEVELALREQSYSVRRVEFDKFVKPIDLLTRKITREITHGEEVSDEEVASLVEQQVKFSELAIQKGFEGALRDWGNMCVS